MVNRSLLIGVLLLMGMTSIAQDSTTIDDTMNSDSPEFFYPHQPRLPDYRIRPEVPLRFSDEINQNRERLTVKDYSFPVASTVPLPYAQDLMDCVGYGGDNGGSCGNCAKGVRHSLMCLHKTMTGATSHQYILCGRGAYAYNQNDCMERMGFERVTGDVDCSRPGAIRVYEGHKTNNYANCDRYQNGDYCGHIEFVGTDQRYYDTVCEPQDEPRNENAAPGTRNLVACFHLKEWTDPSTWYR